MTDCGYTPDQIRLIELPDLWRFASYLNKHPSTRDLIEAIARTLGVEVPTGTKPAYMTGEELKRLVDMTGGKIEGLAKYG